MVQIYHLKLEHLHVFFDSLKQEIRTVCHM